MFLKFGSNCIEEFMNYIEELGETHTIFAYAYNTTYDFHQLLPEFQRRYGKNLKVTSTIGNGIQVRGKLSIPSLVSSSKIVIEFYDL